MSHNRQFDSLSPLETLEQFPGWLMRYLQGDKKPDLTGPEYGPVRPPTGPVHGPERPPAPTKKAPTPPTPAARMRERSSGTPANLKMPAGLASIPDSPPAQKKGVPGTSGFSYTPNPSDFKPPQLRRPPLPEIPRVEPMNFVPPNLVGGARPHVQGPSPNAPIPTPPVAQAQEGNISPNTPQRSNDDLRAMLYAQLMAKLQGGSESRDNMNLMNSFAANLQKNANYVGSIGGNVGTNTSMTDMANDIRQQGAAKQSDQDKVRDYLLNQMQQRDALGAKDSAQQKLFAHQKELANINAGPRKEAAERAREAAERAIEEKEGARYTKAHGEMDAAKAPRSGVMATAARTVDQADKVLAYGSKLLAVGTTPQDMHEMAQASAALLTNSTSPAVTNVKGLIPPTARASFAGTYQWIMNMPADTNQKAFIKRMIGVAELEQKVARETMKSYQAKPIKRHRLNETQAKDLREQYFDPDDEFDKNGNYIKKPVPGTSWTPDPQAPKPEDQAKIQQYLEANPGVNPEKARSILIKRKVIGG